MNIPLEVYNAKPAVFLFVFKSKFDTQQQTEKIFTLDFRLFTSRQTVTENFETTFFQFRIQLKFMQFNSRCSKNPKTSELLAILILIILFPKN